MNDWYIDLQWFANTKGADKTTGLSPREIANQEINRAKSGTNPYDVDTTYITTDEQIGKYYNTIEGGNAGETGKDEIGTGNAAVEGTSNKNIKQDEQKEESTGRFDWWKNLLLKPAEFQFGDTKGTEKTATDKRLENWTRLADRINNRVWSTARKGTLNIDGSYSRGPEARFEHNPKMETEDQRQMDKSRELQAEKRGYKELEGKKDYVKRVNDETEKMSEDLRKDAGKVRDSLRENIKAAQTVMNDIVKGKYTTNEAIRQALVQSGETLRVKIEALAKNIPYGEKMQAVRATLNEAVSKLYTMIQLADQGASQQKLMFLADQFDSEILSVLDANLTAILEKAFGTEGWKSDNKGD